MAEFKYLIHFADEKGDRFFADIDSTEPVIGAQVNAHRSFEDLKEKKNAILTTIAKVLQILSRKTFTFECRLTSTTAPPSGPAHDLPIYCVGLNYKSHAKEANVSTSLYKVLQRLIKNQLNIPVNPPVWTKPPATLAGPDKIITMNQFCASHLPDWEVSATCFAAKPLPCCRYACWSADIGRALFRDFARMSRPHCRRSILMYSGLYNRQ